MKLRPYQSDCVQSILSCLVDGDSTLAVLPTGTGKTVIFGHVCEQWTDRRVLVIAHREELIIQAADSIERIIGERPEVEMGEYWASRESLISRPHVVVSSVQTMSRPGRQKGFDPHDFGLVIIDEAHHATAKSYRQVIEHFRQGGLKVLGVTATPDRSDESALGQIFGSVAYHYQITDAIRDGWLVPIQQEVIEAIELDFSGIKTTAGDLNQGQLEDVMTTERALHEVAVPTAELCGGRQAIVFTAGVAHAHRLAEILSARYGIRSAALDGTSDSDERREIIRAYKSGDIQCLCNCGLFLEGFDAPSTSLVVMARPTKSRALYSQMAGRATRPLPGTVDGYDTPELRRQAIADSGKPNMLILDFAGNSGRHSLVSAADILGGEYSDEVVERAKRNAAKSAKPRDVAEMLDEAEKELLEEQRQRIRAEVRAKASYVRRRVSAFEVLNHMPARVPAWFASKPVTEKQQSFLVKSGFDEKDVAAMNMGEASSIIDKLISRRNAGLCSVKQAKVLAKYGESSDVTFTEASRLIDAIARNGWRPLNGRGAGGIASQKQGAHA